MAIGQRIFVRVALAAALSLGACASEPAAEPVATNGPAVSWEEFRDATVRDRDGAYIVDGDIALASLAELRDFYDASFPRPGALIIQKNPDGSRQKQPDQQKHSLTYCVSDSFGAHKAAVVEALAAGAGAWELAADVGFVYRPEHDASCVATNNNVYFNVQPIDGGGYLARSFFPGAGRSQRQLIIDNMSFGNIGFPLRNVLGHELGHVLGFRHEHTRPEAGGVCFEDNNWLPLTPYDSASIMNYPQCNSTTTQMEMTARDKQGAALVYGLPIGTPLPPGNSVSDTRSGSVSAMQMVQFGAVQVVAGSVFRASLTGTGDADLYVRWGAAPSTAAYTCRPFTGTTNETCELTVPAGVTQAFVAVRGYAAQSTYTLMRTWFAP